MKYTAFQILHQLVNMTIVDIKEGVFDVFQLVKVYLNLFYLVLIAVKLAKSDFPAIFHLKVAGSRFVVQDLNLHGRDDVFAGLYHFFIVFIFIFVDALIRRNEEVIRSPNFHARI